jgi:hypothetical protein
MAMRIAIGAGGGWLLGCLGAWAAAEGRNELAFSAAVLSLGCVWLMASAIERRL